jgi:oligoribonuclease
MRLKADNLIWIDLEMTGLDVDNDRIIEMAAIITDSWLEIIAESSVYVIHQTPLALDAMDAWNTRQHSHSGLTERVKNSTMKESDAEESLLEFLSQYVPPGKSPMCGNSICQDRRFLHRHMPKLENYFHYRNLDVTTVKMLAERWAPNIAAGISKVSTHTALQDIRDSIEELRYYQQYFFKI